MAWPHVARVWMQFLEDEGNDTTDWPPCLDHLYGITFQAIRHCQVEPVQDPSRHHPSSHQEGALMTSCCQACIQELGGHTNY